MTHRVTTVADAVDGLNEDHVCTVHGRFVMDLLGKVWKLRWLGLGLGTSLLFLGLGTGLGSALVVEGHLVPLELAHLPCQKRTCEGYLGIRGLKRLGKKKWRQAVADIVARLTPALRLDDVVLGGGNARNLEKLPKGCPAGDNANAFVGGFLLWKKKGK